VINGQCTLIYYDAAGLVMFSFILGITLCKMGEKGKPLYDFFVALAEAMMLITNWVIW
jgi:Na+/H+-dicarboxylate symporter